MVLFVIWLALVTFLPSLSTAELVTRLMGARDELMFTPARVRSAFTPALISILWPVAAAVLTVSGVDVRICSVVPSKK